MWKTTDRYVQQKRLKAVDAESKLKQVYIPNYTKPNSAMINNLTAVTGTSITATTKGGSILNGSANGNLNSEVTYSCGKPCESCSTTQSTQVGRERWPKHCTLLQCINLNSVFSLFFCSPLSSLLRNSVVCLGTSSHELSFMPQLLDLLEEVWRP